MVAIDAIVAPVVAAFLTLVTGVLFYFAFALDQEIHTPDVLPGAETAAAEEPTDVPAAD